jgi:hypothetical protein
LSSSFSFKAAASLNSRSAIRRSRASGSLTHPVDHSRRWKSIGAAIFSGERVRPDFRLHSTDALYVADSSVFPGNLGVNPQIAIMDLAELCADQVGRR